MVVATAFGNQEILQIADAVAREKGIGKDDVLIAMEQAIQVAGRRKYGFEHDIRANIDRKSGEIRMYRVTTVVEEIEDDVKQITLDEAKKRDPELEIGSEITEMLPPIDFGRIAAQTAKQVIVQRVRDAERDREFEEYKERIGEITSGMVKRVEFGHVIVDLGRAEAVIQRDQLIPRETLRQNDRVRAYVLDVRRERSGPQIFLSRSAPEFMVKLFGQEVPEVYDGIIEIKSCARDPGSRAKIAVYSHDANIDPVGSCVGVRGSRVQAVVNELQGEKIDIIQWTLDPAAFVVNALAPAEVSRVVIDEENGRIEVVVGEDQLSLAIGRRGQNVRLASQLSGWEIDVMTEDEASTKRADEFNRLTNLFTEALAVEEVIAQLLATEGFHSIEEVAYVEQSELARIEGFDDDVAAELQRRAESWLEEQASMQAKRFEELGVQQDLLDLDGVTQEMALVLAEKGIKSRDDLAELSRDEFVEVLPESGMKYDEIDDLIMRARAHWFENEEGGQEVAAS